MKKLPFIDVDYRRYGFKNKKPTRIWTNQVLKNPKPKLCNHKNNHEI